MLKMAKILNIFRRNQIVYLNIRQMCIEVLTNITINKTPGVRRTRNVDKALYGGKYMVTMIPGDAAGQVLMCSLQKVFTHIGAPITFEPVEINMEKADPDGLNNIISSIIRNGVGIKGFIERDFNEGHDISRELILRNQLDLYVNVTRCNLCPAVDAKHKDFDIVIIRQNTEGEYSMLEHMNVNGIVENLKIVTRRNSERIARFAFEYAKQNKRKNVTIIHKADMFALSDGLFLDTCKKVGEDYPEIETSDMQIDSCCRRLIYEPQQFDVLLMTNLYGTIITNSIIGISSGGGILSSRNYGTKNALFEPAARFYESEDTGVDSVNPIVILNAGVDMLFYLGLVDYANRLEQAIIKTICEDCIHTSDLGGTSTTDDVNEHIMNLICPHFHQN